MIAFMKVFSFGAALAAMFVVWGDVIYRRMWQDTPAQTILQFMCHWARRLRS